MGSPRTVPVAPGLLRGGAVAMIHFLLFHLAAGARMDQSAELISEPPEPTSEGSGGPSFRLAGVPIYGAQPMPRTRLAPGQKAPAREWIVVLEPDSTNHEVQSLCGGLEGCLGGSPAEGGVPFAGVSLSDDDLEAALRQRPGRVSFVEADMPVSIIPEVPGDEPSEPLEVHAGDSMLQSSSVRPGRVPWGIRKVGADKARGSSAGAGVHVYVLDTGIRVSHQEFGGRAVPALDVTTGRLQECDSRSSSCARDLQGHGTHCAGTVGGESDGVANGVQLYGVKVLDDKGNGQVSWSIAGLDWILRKGRKPTVASMSLGGAGTSPSYKRSIERAVSGGITVVVAAGNDKDDACGYSPAFAPFAITVGATTSRNQRSGFSNFGSCVNIFAPGSSIESASHTSDRGYATQSGTSMACPHVAGAAARLLSANKAWRAQDVLKELQRVGRRNAVSDSRGSANLLLYVAS